MHFKKISIEFDGEWILRHRLSKKLPINTFIDLIMIDSMEKLKYFILLLLIAKLLLKFQIFQKKI